MPIPRGYSFSGCRAIGHAWEVDHWRKPQYGEAWAKDIVVLQCLRCTGTRSDWMGNYGQVVYRRYNLPDEYSLHATYSRSEWRDWWAARNRPKTDTNVIDITA